MPEPKYSILVTHYNDGKTIKAAIDSLLPQIDDRFELIVADNFSTDESVQILDDYYKRGKIKLFSRKGSRGVGREAALEAAIGEYIISGLDMDDTFKPRLGQLLDFYHSKCEGKLLLTEVATHVAPRDLVVKLGGYRDLQNNENWDLFRRSAKEGKFCWTIFPLLETILEHPERRSLFGKVRYEYTMVRDDYRVGKRPYKGYRGRVRLYRRLAQFLALLALPFYESYRDESFKRFTTVNREYFTDSSDWWPDLKDSKDLKRKYRSLLDIELK
ncbi:MAG TPA: glycosyltransferase family 2 protein [Nitrososphaerales archaeon]|nr:glycosyltransferase family 2 protein [Nitrososphaerales archaeon]